MPRQLVGALGALSFPKSLPLQTAPGEERGHLPGVILASKLPWGWLEVASSLTCASYLGFLGTLPYCWLAS